MSTSQLLKNLVGMNTLSVSSMSNHKIMNLKGGLWSDNTIPAPRGITQNNNLVAYTSENRIFVNDKITKNNIITYETENNLLHQILFNKDSGVIACDTKNSKIIKCDASGVNDYWIYPGSENNTLGMYAVINGICKYNDVVKYATIIGVSSTINADNWRDSARNKQGILIDLETNLFVLNNLFMPHSPIVINDYIYILNSGAGELVRIKVGTTGTYEVVGSYNKWLRGICQLNDQYLAIGVSQGRDTAFSNLDIDVLTQPGIMVVDINTGEMVEFEALDIREVFDIVVTPNGVVNG